MTDSPQKKSDAEAVEPVGGARLAAARIDHEVSVRDIAKELHLDEPTVLAIEQNNFDILGAPVFAKGHLRKYAELVGVPVEDVITDYYQMTRSDGMPPVVARPRPKPRAELSGPMIAAVIVLLTIGGTAYWWYARTPATAVAPPTDTDLAPFATQSTAASVAEPDLPADEPAEENSAADAAPPVADASAGDTAVETGGDPAPVEVLAEAVEREPQALPEAATEVAADAVAAEAAAPVEAESGLPRVTLELSFTGDCWTEIFDAGGRRLFYDLGTAGRIVTVFGSEPFQVILGDSSKVSMTVDGRDYPVPLPPRSGGLTRLSVNSQ